MGEIRSTLDIIMEKTKGLTMSEEEKRMDYQFSSSYTVRKGRQAVIGRAVLSENLLGLDIQKSLYYLDDLSAPHPPEDNPGQFGTMAWLFEDLKRFEGGEYGFRFTLFFTTAYEEGDETALFNIADYPLQWEVR